MEKAKLMQLELDKKKKLPKEIKDNISSNIFKDLIAALIIMIYLVSINVIYYKLKNNVFEYFLKFFAFGIIIITVIAIEIAYRKKSVQFALIGIELFLCGVLSLYIPYIYLHTTNTLRNVIMLIPAGLVLYYLIKACVVYKHSKFKYQNNLSDIKEIINDEKKRVSYLDEDSEKVYKKKLEKEEEIKQKLLKEQDIRKKIKKQKQLEETKEKEKIEEKKDKKVKEIVEQQQDEEIVKKAIIKNKSKKKKANK